MRKREVYLEGFDELVREKAATGWTDEAFESLYNFAVPCLEPWVLQMLRNRPDAEDCVIVSVTKFCRIIAKNGIEHMRSPRAYLTAMVKNGALNILRSRHFSARIRLGDIDFIPRAMGYRDIELPERNVRSRVFNEIGPLDSYEPHRKNEQAELVRAVLRTLSAQDQAVLTLTSDDYTLAEIAVLSDCSESTVRNRLRSASAAAQRVFMRFQKGDCEYV